MFAGTERAYQKSQTRRNRGDDTYSCSPQRRGSAMDSKSATQPYSTPGHTGSEASGQDGLDELRREFASLKDHVARFASQAGGEAAKSIRGVRESVAAQVGGAASGVTDAG